MALFYPFAAGTPGAILSTFAYPCVKGVGVYQDDPWDRNARATEYNMAVRVSWENKAGERDYSFFAEFIGQLIITDARVVVISNVAESDGDVIIGHVRYEWLRYVAYQEKSWSNHNCITLIYEDQDKTRYLVHITIKSKTNVAERANDILRRACLYRLAMTNEKSDKAVAFYTQYSTGRRITPKPEPKKQLSSVEMPQYYLAPGGQKFRPEWGAPKKEENNA